MSVTNMNSRMAMAERLSVPQLQQAIQSGSLPAYIGVPLIEQKMKAQKQAAVAQQPESKPIAQEVMEQASGIDSVPSNLPVSGYNEGGIVAFAEGGDVDDDFDYEAYLEQQEESDYDDIIRKYVAEADAAGIEGIPINRTKKVEQKYAEGGITRLYQGGDVMERMRIEDPEGYAKMMAAAQQARDAYSPNNASLQNRAPGLPMGEVFSTYGDKARKFLQGNESDVPADLRAYADRGMFSNMPLGGPDSKPPAAPDDNESSVSAMAPQLVAPDMERRNFPPQGSPNASQGAAPSATKPTSAEGGNRTSSAVTAGSTPERTERPKSAFDDFMAEIKASRDDLNKQKSQDKYMALLSAGLGMMSGTSPNAFANIGQGAQMGVASYGASQKQRAAERAALNKNLLMGQRYQSMEDIANRTADINESRYRDAAAARAAGAGDSASLKQDRILDQREAALARAIQQGQATVANALKARFGDTGMFTNKAEYDKAYRDLTAELVAPYIAKRNQLDSQRFPDLFGPNAPKSNAPTPSSGFRIVQ